MTCDFTSFPTVIQSYQDDGHVIEKVVCNGTPFTIEKILASGEARTRDRLISRPALNPTELTGLKFPKEVC